VNLFDSPWLPFHVLAWQSSPRVRAMGYAEQGFYLALLLRQWDKGSVPASIDACAAALGQDVETIRPLWPRVAACFEPRPGDVMINKTLDQHRKNRDRYLRERRRCGKLGGIKKASNEVAGYHKPSTSQAPATLDPSQDLLDLSRSIDLEKKKDQSAARSTFAQGQNEKRKRPRVTDEPSPSGNLAALVKLAHEVLAEADPYVEPVELKERLKDQAAAARIDYGNDPDVRTDAIEHALEIARLQKQYSNENKKHSSERDTRGPDHRSDFTAIRDVSKGRS
jgi:hypothetical protein